jgi:hypothetical protein
MVTFMDTSLMLSKNLRTEGEDALCRPLGGKVHNEVGPRAKADTARKGLEGGCSECLRPDPARTKEPA